MEFLRDPIWQFVGTIISAIAVLVTIYIFWRQRRVKSLGYAILANEELLSVQERIKQKVRVTYKGKPIDNVHLISLLIFNSGNMPIQASDYERPLSFSFGEGVEILSADISKAIPKSLNPSITIEKSRVVFVPILLNSKDQIQISLLLAKYQGVVEPDVRITGITDVKEHYYGPISNIDDKYWLRRSTSITTWMVIFWILFRFPINPTPFFHENLLITFFLAFLTAIILDWIIESAILFTRLLLSGNKFVWK